MPNGEAFAKVSLAFLQDDRTSPTDRAVYAAVVSALNHRTSSGTVEIARICRRSGLQRGAVSRSLQRIASWGYWILDRPPNGRYTFALAGTEAALELASREGRRRSPPTKDRGVGSTPPSLDWNALPGIEPTRDLELATNGDRRGDPKGSAPLSRGSTELRDSLQRKDLGADRSPNGVGAYDPEAEYLPGPDDPKLFELEDPAVPRFPFHDRPNAWTVPPGYATLADWIDAGRPPIEEES